MTQNQTPVTEAQVRAIVGEVVGEIVSDALNLIGQRLDKQDMAIARIENKLDASIDWLGNHEIRLRQLESTPV